MHCIFWNLRRSPQDLEEGEIRAADEDLKQTEACYSSLNLALYEMLSGNSSQAAMSIQAALHRHEGNLHVRACLLHGILHYCHLSLVVNTIVHIFSKIATDKTLACCTTLLYQDSFTEVLTWKRTALSCADVCDCRFGFSCML